MQDSIYFKDDSALYVNLFIPSTLNWKSKSVSVRQSTSFPASDTTTLTVTGSGTWQMKIRIPSWTKGASIAINGATQAITANPGSYAAISRTWKSGDTVTVKLPMSLRVIAANDNKNVGALAYGPSILSGNYGSTALSANPKLDLGSVQRVGTTGLSFKATADGKAVNLGPFSDAQGFEYAVYWSLSGSLST